MVLVRKVGMYAMHCWLMAMDDSRTYQAKDAAGFASETRMQISMCSGYGESYAECGKPVSHDDVMGTPGTVPCWLEPGHKDPCKSPWSPDAFED